MVCGANRLDKILKFLKTYIKIDGYLDKITLVLRGARAKKKREFWTTFSKKRLETSFLASFFKNTPAALKNSV